MQVIDVNVTNKGTRAGGIQSFTAMVVVGNYNVRPPCLPGQPVLEPDTRTEISMSLSVCCRSMFVLSPLTIVFARGGNDGVFHDTLPSMHASEQSA